MKHPSIAPYPFFLVCAESGPRTAPPARIHMSAPEGFLRNEPIDVSQDSRSFEPEYFIATRAAEFNPENVTGMLARERYVRSLHHSFGQTTAPFEQWNDWEFSHGEYPLNHVLLFPLTFVSPRTGPSPDRGTPPSAR